MSDLNQTNNTFQDSVQSGIGKRVKYKNDDSLKSRKFKYVGMRSDGSSARGAIEAESFAEAKFKIETGDFTLLKIEESKPWWEVEFGQSVPTKAVLQLTRQLASFAQAGIPISQGLKVLASSTTNKKLRKALNEIKSEIEGGSSFSESIAHQNRIFPIYFVPIIAASELTGSINRALQTLNDYLDRDVRSRRAVNSALAYPIVLIFLSFVSISVLSVVVLPRFESFFESLSVDLPLPTKILLSMTRFFGSWWWLVILILIILVITVQITKKSTFGRLLIDKTKLKLPILGKFVQLVSVERFCRILETLVTNQVPLPNALVLAGESTSNASFIEGVKRAKIEVLNGNGLAFSLEKMNCFPDVAIQIMKVGEESGQLGLQLSQASRYYSDELDFRMKNFTGLIEPIVLIILGGGIGFVAVALISAMYGIYSGVQG